MRHTAELSVGMLTGEFPCPRDGTILAMLPGGAWCPKCHTVWRESGEIAVPPPLAAEIDRLRTRVAELEEAVRACFDDDDLIPLPSEDGERWYVVTPYGEKSHCWGISTVET